MFVLSVTGDAAGNRGSQPCPGVIDTAKGTLITVWVYVVCTSSRLH